ncbi:hypothetical protein P5V15_003438 [Pogonomyrmex californicus]
MYRAVIVCLIGLAYTTSVSSVQIKDTRQELTVPAYLLERNGQFRNIPNYPTYPEYSSAKYVEQSEKRKLSGAEMALSQKTPVSKSLFLISSLMPFIDNLIFYGIYTGSYLLRYLVAILLSTTFIGLICTQTSICNFLGFDARNIASTFITPEHLNFLTAIVNNATDKYSALQHSENLKKNAANNTRIQ